MIERWQRRLRATIFAVLAVANLGATAAAQTGIVAIDGLQFRPATLTVRQGDTVVWRNRDLFVHNVTAASGAFKSGDIAANGSWKFIATRKGEFPYVCTLHPTMKGTLVVR